VKDLLDHSVKLIILTSPTYEGVKSELAEICKLAHGMNIPVLVDAAHGAHFFSEYSCADMVVMSLHKTLPALTQCAVLHVYGNLCNADKIALSLSVFETSSPSYVLMSSAEICIDFCINNISAFSDYRKNLRDFYQINLHKLKLLKYDDMGKLVVFCGGYMSGFELADILRKNYNIEIEMAAPDYIICMTSVCDSKENLEALKNALESIDSGLGEEINREKMTIPKEHNKVIMPPFKVNDSNESYSPEYSAGKMSSEYIFAYPPGIPLIVPGEIINEELADYIVSAVNSGANMLSSSGLLPDKIKCQKI
jgi:arginine/lysine/ornithine decarboxylase